MPLERGGDCQQIHRVQRKLHLILTSLALAWLGAACSSVPPKHVTSVPDTDAPQSLPTNAVAAVPAAIPAIINNLPPAQVLTNLATNGAIFLQPTNRVSSVPWVELGSVLNRLGGNLAYPPNVEKPVLDWTSGRNLVRMTVGTRQAKFNGQEFWLGFAPILIEGRPFLHPLDVEKHLATLAFGRTNLPLTRPRRVVLDAGHGGDNKGTKSVLGEYFEKDFALDWARRVKKRLEAKGIEVWMTRTNDATISLTDRTAFTERAGAELFVSLHFNAGSVKTNQRGIEAYCLTPLGMPSTLTREFEDNTAQEFPNNAFDQANFEWALRLQKALLNATGTEDRGVRHARFMGVLRGHNRPAVLIEGGYLSSPAEARVIADPNYRQKLADAVADGILALPRNHSPTLASPAPGAKPEPVKPVLSTISDGLKLPENP